MSGTWARLTLTHCELPFARGNIASDPYIIPLFRRDFGSLGGGSSTAVTLWIRLSCSNIMFFALRVKDEFATRCIYITSTRSIVFFSLPASSMVVSQIVE